MRRQSGICSGNDRGRRMLTITRRRGESVWIDGAKVTVVRCGNSRVQLTIEAPREVLIVRDELRDDSESERKLGESDGEVHAR